ncbi:MAG: hypothetical protein IJC07_00860 [Clostridia bacterium]|nr:hypothetical protein [Clostridia bacterium]
MKIVKVYVSSFGKLKDFSYDFCDGLNTIKQNNGWGKSTLATFIKAMFYGLDGSAKRSIEDNERKKFKPWNSTQTFGGFVQFTWGQNEYKLERYFGNKEAEDTITLTDVKTGKTFSNTENLGKRIFEIDAEGFSLTTYFAQKDLESKSNTSLTEKFNSVCDIDNTDAFDNALESVVNKAKKYKYSGDRGLIPDAKREIYALNEQIDRTARAQATANALKQEVNSLEEEVKLLSAKTKDLTTQISIAGRAEANAIKKERYQKLLSEKTSLEGQIVSAKATLNGVSRENIADCERKVMSLENLKTNQKSLEIEIENLKTSNKNVETKIKSPAFIILLMLTAIFAIAGGILAVAIGLTSVIPWVALGVAFLTAIGAILFKVMQKNKQKLHTNPLDEIIENKTVQLNQYSQQITALESEIFAFISAFNLENQNINEGLKLLDKAVQETDLAKQNLIKINAELLELEDKKHEFLSSNFDTKTPAELNASLSELQRLYSQKSNELANKKSSVTAYENIANTYDDLEDKKTDVLDKIVAYEDELETLNLVAKYLKLADENLKVRYRAPLQDSLNKYVSLLTDGKYSVNIDIDLNVSVCESTGDKDTEFYSKGYQNLFEICKRFALIDVLFTGEKPFIILDDTFYNLDEEKLNLALDLIKKLSSEYQIVYLVCHQSREVK